MTDRPSGDLGTRLREAREGRGVSLRDLANETKISVSALEALERNQIARLPGGIFSRAFVRSYAVAVGLDPESCIREFIAQFPQDSVTAGHPSSKPIEDGEAMDSERRVASTFIGLGVLSVAVLGVILYFGTMTRSKKPQSAGTAVAPAPPASTVSVPSPAPALAPEAVPAADAAPSVDRAPALDRAASPAVLQSSPASVSALTGAPLRITLSATRDCWVSATADGERAIARLLRAGEQRSLEVHRELTLTAGDAAALQVTLNGAPARPLGRAGEVVTVRYGVANFAEYLKSP